MVLYNGYYHLYCTIKKLENYLLIIWLWIVSTLVTTEQILLFHTTLFKFSTRRLSIISIELWIWIVSTRRDIKIRIVSEMRNTRGSRTRKGLTRRSLKICCQIRAWFVFIHWWYMLPVAETKTRRLRRWVESSSRIILRNNRRCVRTIIVLHSFWLKHELHIMVITCKESYDSRLPGTI